MSGDVGGNSHFSGRSLLLSSDHHAELPCRRLRHAAPVDSSTNSKKSTVQTPNHFEETLFRSSQHGSVVILKRHKKHDKKTSHILTVSPEAFFFSSFKF